MTSGRGASRGSKGQRPDQAPGRPCAQTGRTQDRPALTMENEVPGRRPKKGGWVERFRRSGPEKQGSHWRWCWCWAHPRSTIYARRGRCGLIWGYGQPATLISDVKLVRLIRRAGDRRSPRGLAARRHGVRASGKRALRSPPRGAAGPTASWLGKPRPHDGTIPAALNPAGAPTRPDLLSCGCSP